MNESKKMELVRHEDGRVKSGCLNPNGYNGWTRLNSLLQAIKYEGKMRGTGFENHIAKRFYINDAVLMAVLKKAVPEERTNSTRDGKGDQDVQIIVKFPEEVLNYEQVIDTSKGDQSQMP